MDVITPASVAIRDFVTAVRNWFAVMGYLTVQQLNENIGAGKFGLLLALAEPILFIILVYFIRGFLRGMMGYYGTSLMLFLVSGFMTFFLFVRVSLQFRGSQRNVRRTMPRINSMDVYLSRVIVTALIWLVMIGVVLLALWTYGIDAARPKMIDECAAAIGFLFMLAVGMGLLNSSIAHYFPLWRMMITRMSRGLLLLSGVIHMPIAMNSKFRAVIEWNPVTHAIELFRIGLYGNAYPSVLDRPFLLYSALIILFVGVVVDRATLRYASR